MRVPEHRAGGRGELVAIDLPLGEEWLEVVGDLWWRGVSFMPVDARLTDRQRRALVDLARPTCVLDRLGETAYAGAPVGEAVALVVPTSGTAGAPRLVELARGAVESAIAASAAAIGVDDAVPWIACLTPAHIGGLLVVLRGAVLGVPVIVHDRFDPARIAQAGADGGACVSLVPAMVTQMVEAEVPLAGLTMLVGAGGLDPAIGDTVRERGARVVTTYGLTETCGGVVYDGWPLHGTRFRLDPEGGVELKGPTLMEGYRGDPAATGAAFTTDGWLRTGDLGAVSDDERLAVHGRADDLIRTGGEKVWPEEVERVLRAHPKVGDVAVGGAPDARWGSQVVAFVVPALIEEPPDLEELRGWVAGRLERFKAPRRLELVPAIPRTASGKIRRALLGQI